MAICLPFVRAARLPGAALLAAAFAAASFAAPAQARPGIDGVRFDAPVTVRYRCDDGKQLTARYFNSADNQIAILRLDGKPLLFVSVLSASGARYAHGQHVWWTKGDEGMLQDMTQGENAPPVYANCRARR
ncbi:MliC family protein [Cupriavidus sp. ISTL7]|nr:MliC family protein [Cupriavidus sp. ISTL7]